MLHALVHRGPRWALGLVVVTAGGGLAAEAVGVRTGLPFGDYSYAGTLGPEVLDVPRGRAAGLDDDGLPRAARGPPADPALGACRSARSGWPAWDVFLDPQMVGDGRWRWADPTPSLPGVDRHPADQLRRLAARRRR